MAISATRDNLTHMKHVYPGMGATGAMFSGAWLELSDAGFHDWPDWNGLACDVTITRIHGKNDLVIPLPSEVLNPIDGGHLIAMTHAQECVDRIRGF